jgi:hypothetical protein
LTRPARPPVSPPGPRQGGWPDERHASYRRVECDRCAATVAVAKFSAQHTSVQWSPASVLACAEFTAAAQQSPLIEGCATLRASIDKALAEGRIEVSPP